MKKEQVFVGNLATKAAIMLLSPMIDQHQHISNYRFDGYKKIEDVFPDATIAKIIANQLMKDVTTEILVEELALIRSIIYIPLKVEGQEPIAITTLEGIGYLVNLSVLRIHNFTFTQLPTEFKHLVSLKELDFSTGNLINIPDAICNHTQLEQLRLRKVNLTEVNPKIQKLQKLTTLNLSNNQLTELPVEINFLDKVKVLRLNDNPLIVLPNEIGYLDALESLDVSDTKLQTLPITLVRAECLKIVNINNTKITMLSDDFFLQMHQPFKIVGKQFSLTTEQIEILQTKKKIAKVKSKNSMTYVLIKSLAVAAVITTCVVLAVNFQSNRKLKGKKHKK